MGESSSATGIREFTFPEMPEWMENPPVYPPVYYEYAEGAPEIFGLASLYGKFDGNNVRDTFSCGPLAIHDGRKFNPFKPYIALRDIPLGTFLEISLVDKDQNPILNAKGEAITMTVEASDWGPDLKTGRKFDMSYGTALEFSRLAGIDDKEQKSFVTDGEIYLKARVINPDEASKQVIRAYTFVHKLTSDIPPDEFEQYTACLNLDRREDGYYVTPSVGDKIAVGWHPGTGKYFDQCNNVCTLKNVYRFCGRNTKDDLKENFNKSLNGRFEIMGEFDIQAMFFSPFRTVTKTERGKEVCFGTDITNLSLDQALYLYDLLQGHNPDKYRNMVISCEGNNQSRLIK